MRRRRERRKLDEDGKNSIEDGEKHYRSGKKTFSHAGNRDALTLGERHADTGRDTCPSELAFGHDSKIGADDESYAAGDAVADASESA